jgi:hypothetical protein
MSRIGSPEDWSDGEKLRLLADVLDIQDRENGESVHTVQDDLRRIAKRIDDLDYLENVMSKRPCG